MMTGPGLRAGEGPECSDVSDANRAAGVCLGRGTRMQTQLSVVQRRRTKAAVLNTQSSVTSSPVGASWVLLLETANLGACSQQASRPANSRAGFWPWL